MTVMTSTEHAKESFRDDFLTVNKEKDLNTVTSQQLKYRQGETAVVSTKNRKPGQPLSGEIVSSGETIS